MARHAASVEGSGEGEVEARGGSGERASRQVEDAGAGGREQQEAIRQGKAADVLVSTGLLAEHSAAVEAKLWKDDV